MIEFPLHSVSMASFLAGLMYLVSVFVLPICLFVLSDTFRKSSGEECSQISRNPDHWRFLNYCGLLHFVVGAPTSLHWIGAFAFSDTVKSTIAVVALVVALVLLATVFSIRRSLSKGSG